MSNYLQFEVLIDNDDGTTTPVPAATIAVYDVTNDVALDDIASDVDGHVAAGTVDTDAGNTVRLSFRLDNGLCGFSEQVTT
ncbi:MAG: hypothetical protein ACRD9S_13170 [Pyrinomonadaceae bacterium]